MEFAPAGLNGDHGAEGGLVPELPSQQLIGDGLSLGRGGQLGTGKERMNNKREQFRGCSYLQLLISEAQHKSAN